MKRVSSRQYLLNCGVTLVLLMSHVGLRAEAKDSPRSMKGPMLARLNEAADIIAVGRVVKTPTHVAGYNVVKMELDRIIAAVSDEKEIIQNVGKKAATNQVLVLEKLPLSDESAFFVTEGRYLCWLTHQRALETRDTNHPFTFSGTYSVVQGANGTVLLSDPRDLPCYAYVREKLGENFDLNRSSNRRLEANFGTNDVKRIVDATSQFARLMALGKDNTRELQELAGSTENVFSKTASRLLELGNRAKRFGFVESPQPPHLETIVPAPEK